MDQSEKAVWVIVYAALLVTMAVTLLVCAKRTRKKVAVGPAAPPLRYEVRSYPNGSFQAFYGGQALYRVAETGMAGWAGEQPVLGSRSLTAKLLFESHDAAQLLCVDHAGGQRVKITVLDLVRRT